MFCSPPMAADYVNRGFLPGNQNPDLNFERRGFWNLNPDVDFGSLVHLWLMFSEDLRRISHLSQQELDTWIRSIKVFRLLSPSNFNGS